MIRIRRAAWPGPVALGLIAASAALAQEVGPRASFGAVDGGWIGSLAFSPDGKTIASSGYGGIRVWDAETGVVVRQFPTTGVILSVTFSPDGKTIASGGSTKANEAEIVLRDLGTGQEVRLIPPGNDRRAQVSSVAFSPDGKTLATGNLNWHVLVWGLHAGGGMAKFQGTCPILAVDFRPDGRSLAYGSTCGNFDLFDLAGGQRNPVLNEKTTAGRRDGHKDGINSVAFSPDGKTLATGSLDRSVKLWDVATGEVAATCLGHEDEVQSVAFSPDGKTLASAGRDKSVRLWDVATGKQVARRGSHADHVQSVAFSPDGKTLASGSLDGTIKLWDIAGLKKTGD